MSHVIITFDIIEYFPSDFNFDEYSFIISSENREFEQEISYINQNQISHKASFNKKDLKYSIKVIKGGALIGISDIIIPSQILSKKEGIFDKTCPITMTDSVKKIIFGNNFTSANSLKINLHLTLQYFEKEKNFRKRNIKKESKIKKNFSSDHYVLEGNYGQESSVHSVNNSQKNNKRLNSTKQIYSNSKKGINMKMSHLKGKANTSNKLKQTKKTFTGNDNDKKIRENNIIYKDKDKDKNKQNEEINNNNIDEELNELKEIKEIDPKLINFINEFKEKYPLNKLNSFNNVNEMKEYTKDILQILLDYQLKYYDLINKSIDTKNKFKKLLIEYNEKYRIVRKELKLLEEKNDLYGIKDQLKEKQNNKELNDLITIKENELDIFKELYGNYINNNGNQNKDPREKKLEEKRKNEERVQSILVKVLTQAVNKYGPINNLYTKTNSTETERINIRKLANKYNLSMDNKANEDSNINNNQKEEKKDIVNSNEESKDSANKNNDNNSKQELKQENEVNNNKITKWEYVSTEKPDKIDFKLENYLKYFYEKRTFPKIIFKKLSTNNYEYGTQKIMIKIEGDTIRIRYIGGYLLIDKFIEINSIIEEKKLKKNNNEKSNATSKKNITSNKKK